MIQSIVLLICLLVLPIILRFIISDMVGTFCMLNSKTGNWRPTKAQRFKYALMNVTAKKGCKG